MIESFALAPAGFVGIAEEMRKGLARIAVQGEKHDVVATVKDFLAAVTVVEIDVEQCDARSALVDKCLYDYGGVVDEAITPEHVGGGVMAGRATQREGFTRSVADGRLRGQRHICTCPGGFPGAVGYRGFSG